MDWVSYIKDCIRDDRVVLHAQKFTAMRTHQYEAIDCCEVLARLLDTQGNLVYPGSFIQAAERYGLIGDLDRHIIRKAFSKLQILPAGQRGKSRYFINVSGVTLSTPGFRGYVAQMLADHADVRPHNVCFEVTETAAIWSLAQTAKIIRQLVEEGFSFALDDFGSGMSSFSYLQQLPVQYIKIDGAFIKGILTDPTGAVIVEAVVKVARAMDILTVAESVEFPELLPIFVMIARLNQSIFFKLLQASVGIRCAPPRTRRSILACRNAPGLWWLVARLGSTSRYVWLYSQYIFSRARRYSSSLSFSLSAQITSSAFNATYASLFFERAAHSRAA